MPYNGGGLNEEECVTELEDAPKIIGRYELLTRLATGGMAELFLARERGLAGLERLVVIKRILPHLADQPSFVEMFLREARIVARLSHPNVVQIYELGQESESYHIAMEYIHGSTVRELLVLAQKKGCQMPLDVAVAIIDQACRGLHAAHELCDLDGKPLGLVHRDISPHNLMCTTDGHVKLLDFGVAKSTSASVEATYSGNLKGKFAYLSPEQCLHEPLDRRSDVFAMGIVMWEMFTMRRLFKRKTELEMMQSIIGGNAPAPSKFREDLPAAIEEVIKKALVTDREDRFASAEALRQALAEAASACGVEPQEKGVADFLSDVAGERLAKRKATVESACERELTTDERRHLLHMTGTSSRAQSYSEVAPDAPTVVERPEGMEGSEVSFQTSEQSVEELLKSAGGQGGAETSGSLTATESLKRGEGTSQPEDGGISPMVVVAALLATLIVGGAVLAISGVFDDEEQSEAVSVADEEDGDDEDGEGQTEDDKEEEIVVSGDPLPLGWAPTIDPKVLAEEVEPLHRYLERKTGRPVPMVLADDYSDLSRKLRSGDVAVAMLPPTLYVLTSEHDDRVEILAMRESDGTASSDGHLLVQRGSDVQAIGDLEGARFCFVDRASTSGHLLPRQYIRRHGFDPDEFVGEVHWSGDHFQVMRDLIDDKCDAAAVYSGAYLSAGEYNIRTGRVSTLGLTGRLPQDVIAIRSDLDKDDAQMMLEALLAFDPQEEFGVERLGRNQRITGFLERDDSDFEQLREIVEAEELGIEDL